MIESTREIIAQLTRSAERMKQVREAAQKLRLLREGAEPEPRRPQILPTQPTPGFTGQLERPNPTLR